jgi:hypothetical protein
MREVEIKFGGSLGRKVGQSKAFADLGTVLLYIGKRNEKHML